MGYNATAVDVEAIVPPTEIDLLVLIGIKVDKPLTTVKKGGFVLSDWRMGSAENVAINHKDFKLVGVIVRQDENEVSVLKDNLGPFEKQLQRTEEDLIKLRRELFNRDLKPDSEKAEIALPLPAGYVFQKQ